MIKYHDMSKAYIQRSFFYFYLYNLYQKRRQISDIKKIFDPKVQTKSKWVNSKQDNKQEQKFMQLK